MHDGKLKLISWSILPKTMPRCPCSAHLNECFEDTEKWLVTLFYSFSALLPLRETRLIKIWHGKKVMLHLIYFYADQFDCWLSLGSGEFEPCLVGVGNSNCFKSFQWNTSFVFQYGGLKVNSSWANGLGWTSQGWGSKRGQWVESHNCCWFCFLPKYWPSNLALM